jgi:putative 2OG-Fe(II) oxygenase
MTVSNFGYEYFDDIITNNEAKIIFEEYLKISNLISSNKNKDLNEKKYLKYTSNKDIKLLENPILISTELDSIFEKILSNDQIKIKLANLFKNKKYNLWTIYIRESLPGSDSMVMHQDKENSILLTFAIKGCENKNGTTVFIPKTHKFPMTLHKLKANISPRLFPFLAREKYFIGKPGKSMIYSGELWHARTTNKSNNNNVILSFSFLDRKSLKKNKFSSVVIDNKKFPNLHKYTFRENIDSYENNRIFRTNFLSINGLTNFCHLIIVFCCVILLHLVKFIFPINIIK